MEEGDGCAYATLFLRVGLDMVTGSSEVRLACGSWVYNCLGIPIALQQAKDGAWHSDLMEVGSRKLKQCRA